MDGKPASKLYTWFVTTAMYTGGLVLAVILVSYTIVYWRILGIPIAAFAFVTLVRLGWIAFNRVMSGSRLDHKYPWED